MICTMVGSNKTHYNEEMGMNNGWSSKCGENAVNYTQKDVTSSQKSDPSMTSHRHDSRLQNNSIKRRTDCSGISPSLLDAARAR